VVDDEAPRRCVCRGQASYILTSIDTDPQLIVGWQAFFTAAAGAAAALAGLLFVALSIHAREIAEHPPFRYRALATLSIPLAVLVVSGIALFPRQTNISLGLEELVPLVLQMCALVVGSARPI
jgi:hypothetical protein